MDFEKIKRKTIIFNNIYAAALAIWFAVALYNQNIQTIQLSSLCIAMHFIGRLITIYLTKKNNKDHDNYSDFC